MLSTSNQSTFFFHKIDEKYLTSKKFKFIYNFFITPGKGDSDMEKCRLIFIIVPDQNLWGSVEVTITVETQFTAMRQCFWINFILAMTIATSALNVSSYEIPMVCWIHIQKTGLCWIFDQLSLTL